MKGMCCKTLTSFLNKLEQHVEIEIFAALPQMFGVVPDSLSIGSANYVPVFVIVRKGILEVSKNDCLDFPMGGERLYRRKEKFKCFSKLSLNMSMRKVWETLWSLLSKAVERIGF